jgi:hypothetical protein
MIQAFSFHEREVVALLYDGRPDLKGPCDADALVAKRYGSESFGRQKSTESKSENMKLDAGRWMDAFTSVPRTMYGIALQDSAYQTRGSTAIGCRTMTMRCTLCLLSF